MTEWFAILSIAVLATIFVVIIGSGALIALLAIKNKEKIGNPGLRAAIIVAGIVIAIVGSLMMGFSFYFLMYGPT